MTQPVAAGRPLAVFRYQLAVVASDMADVVRSAGGWLCDRARAGWDVNVVVAGHYDARPLSILGAVGLDVDGDLSAVVKRASTCAELAISSHVLATDDRFRADVFALVKRRLTEVTVWGDDWPDEFGRKVDRVEHKLSSAAHAFKAHALEAAAAPTSSGTATETFFNLDVESSRRLYSV